MIVTLDEFIYRIESARAKIIEERVRLVIKSAPRFIPESLWLKLASKFLIIEVKRF